jgi:RAB6A-GEF complex partner protein 2
MTTNTSLNVGQNSNSDVYHSTNPKILFCDLRLAAGETQSFFFSEKLSPDTPPTYRGVNIKFFYKITIATQRVGSKVQTLNIPIRVLPLPISLLPEEIGALCGETTEAALQPANPFLESSEEKKDSYLEIALEYLQSITARRRPNFYVISNMRGKVGRFCLFKSDYRIGEDIVGTLDFTDRTVRCVQFSVTLQSEEFLKKKQIPEKLDEASGGIDSGDKAEPTPSTSASSVPETPVSGKITSFSKYHDICLGFLQTQMILPIPLHVTPSFKSDLVDVCWKLHFQFVTTISKEMDGPVQPGQDWQAPVNIDIETMIWNLPVKIYPTNPMQLTQTNPPTADKLIIK